MQESVTLPFDSFKADGSLPEKPPSYAESTFQLRYMVDVGQEGHDYWGFTQALFHPNNVVVVGMSTHHALLRTEASSEDTLFVTYCQVRSQDLGSLKDSGAKMRKGIWVTPQSQICTITRIGTNNAEAVCMAGLKGKFLTANPRLIKDPSLLLRRNMDEGFLYILCMHPKEHAEVLENLYTLDQYEKLRGLKLETESLPVL